MPTTRRRPPRMRMLLPALAVALVPLVAAAILLLARAPMESQMRVAQKIFYFHVPLWISAFLAFGVNCVASILVLVRRAPGWDRLAVASAEPGLLYMTLGLATGSIWARPIWNTWWTWEPRLTTALLLWFVYVAYFVLRSRVDDPGRRARAAAVMGIFGFANVPLVYSSVFWLERRYRLHPVVFTPKGAGMEPSMKIAFDVSLLFFLGLLAVLVWTRYRVLRLEDDFRERDDRRESRGAVLASFLPLLLLLQPAGGGETASEQWTATSPTEAALAHNIGYVVGAYALIWAALLLYLAWLGSRVARLESKLEKEEEGGGA